MKRMISMLVVVMLTASSSLAQQLENQGFEMGYDSWTTNYGQPHMNVLDIDGDSDDELVFYTTKMTNQWQDGVLVVQDIPAEYFNLKYGIALAADAGTTNMPLNQDFRAYTKLEFLASTGLMGHLTQSAEWYEGKYAVSNSYVHQSVIMRHPNELTDQFEDIASVRSTLYLLRFDTNKTPTAAAAYFDNVSLGAVSAVRDVPGIVNGGFEFNEWGWRTAGISSWDFVNMYDFDDDGDKELICDGLRFSNQWNDTMYVQEVDASLIDFTSNIVFYTDLGASNLPQGVKVFHKLEFGTNGPPNSGGTILPTVSASSEYFPELYATQNETRINSRLVMEYSNLTNLLKVAGTSVDKLTFVRAILFTLQFDAGVAKVPGSFSWYDNARLEFSLKNPPDAVANRLIGSNVALSWASQTDKTYRILFSDDLYGYKWTNLASGIPGRTGITSYTNPIPTNAATGFFRVRLE